MVKIAAGVLAGGKSSRMGKNKASLEWKGSTFLEHALWACRNFDEVYISVDDRKKYGEFSYPLLEDEKKEYGPLEGIYQVLSHMEAEYAFIMATDMPMITPEFIKVLTDKVTGSQDCLVLRAGGRPQPMCSIYGKSALPYLARMREKGEHKPAMLFEKVKTEYVDLESLGFEPKVINNINTPVEYGTLCMDHGRRLEEFAPYLRKKIREGKVLVCYLDGFGYRMYQQAAKEKRIPFIEKNFSVCPVRTVEPPVTNPAMATILTGVSPEVHGIHSRKDRMMKVPTIFGEIGKNNTAFLEGDTRILKTEMEPKLHTHKKGQGCDHWIFQSAIKAVEEGKTFIFAHFHEIDDMAHSWGPYEEKTMEQIERMDTYISRLSENFCGTFLLISDHGIHQTENGGTHGEDSPDKRQMEEDRLAIWGERYENQYKRYFS